MTNENITLPVENARPKRLPSQYSDKAIANLIVNYNRKGRVEGGPISLKDCLIEQARRSLEGFTEEQITQTIVQLARKNDGLTTYGQLWKQLFPSKQWKGNNSQRIIGKILGSALDLCRLNGWPLITCLVVNAQNNQLTYQAKINIFNYAVRHKLTADTDINGYIEKLQAQCLTYFRAHSAQAL